MPIVGGAEPPVSSKNRDVPGQWFSSGCVKFRAFDIFRLVGTRAPLAPGKGTGGALNVRRLLGISFYERFPATADSRFQCGGDDGAPIGLPV